MSVFFLAYVKGLLDLKFHYLKYLREYLLSTTYLKNKKQVIFEAPSFMLQSKNIRIKPALVSLREALTLDQKQVLITLTQDGFKGKIGELLDLVEKL